jgi:hypothetical protein
MEGIAKTNANTLTQVEQYDEMKILGIAHTGRTAESY